MIPHHDWDHTAPTSAKLALLARAVLVAYTFDETNANLGATAIMARLAGIPDSEFEREEIIEAYGIRPRVYDTLQQALYWRDDEDYPKRELSETTRIAAAYGILRIARRHEERELGMKIPERRAKRI